MNFNILKIILDIKRTSIFLHGSYIQLIINKNIFYVIIFKNKV